MEGEVNVWQSLLGLVIFLAIVYYGFYKKIYLPVAERRKKEREGHRVDKENTGNNEQK